VTLNLKYISVCEKSEGEIDLVTVLDDPEAGFAILPDATKVEVANVIDVDFSKRYVKSM